MPQGHGHRPLNGHKVFVHPEEDTVSFHAVTDEFPLIRLEYDWSVEEAREIGQSLLDAAAEVESHG